MLLGYWGTPPGQNFADRQQRDLPEATIKDKLIEHKQYINKYGRGPAGNPELEMDGNPNGK